MIRLDILADPVCPWCLIGKVELDRALESRPDHPFQISWHPFRLNPDMPRSGMDRADYLTARLGERAAEAEARLTAQAAAVGLTLNPPLREPDTTDAHRLMHWAGLEGAQSRVLDGLMRAHWLQARDISNPAELARIGAAAGMDLQLTARLLASDADRDEVLRREAHARRRGIQAVPTVIVADQHAVTGAQPAALWQQVIDELTADPRA